MAANSISPVLNSLPDKTPSPLIKAGSVAKTIQQVAWNVLSLAMTTYGTGALVIVSTFCLREKSMLSLEFGPKPWIPIAIGSSMATISYHAVSSKSSKNFIVAMHTIAAMFGGIVGFNATMYFTTR